MTEPPETPAETPAETFPCYCGASYETQVLADLCHSFHMAPPMGTWK